jgi:hypothetical protein
MIHDDTKWTPRLIKRYPSPSVPNARAVAQLRGMLEEARQGGEAVAKRVGEARLAAAAAEQSRAAAGAAQALRPPEPGQPLLRPGVSWDQVRPQPLKKNPDPKP